MCPQRRCRLPSWRSGHAMKEGMSVFAVSTPLQLLNAIEARHSLVSPAAKTELWVVAKHPEHRFTWLCAKRIAGSSFSRVRLLELDNVSARSGVWAAVKALWANRRQLGGLPGANPSCTQVFIGNPRTREHLFIASLFPEARLTCLDDGTGTVSLLERVAARGGKDGGGLVAAQGAVAYLKELCFRLFYGNYRHPLREADFFTAFAAQAEAAGFVASRNTYSWLASRQRDKGSRYGTHFLGAPFVERNELSWKTYKAWLQRAASLVPAPVVYVAHWAESDSQLSRIESELGFACRRFERPYEFEYLAGEQAPECVASWFSSALDVLALVPDESVCLIAIEVPVGAFLKADIAASASAFYSRHRDGSTGVEIV